MENSCDLNFHPHAKLGMPLVVSFGGINGGFEFYKSLSQLNVNFLLVRDSRIRWYQQGVVGVERGIVGLVELINVLLKQLGSQRLVVVGASAGGYAALLLGQLLNADQVLAYGPQSFLSAQFRKNINEHRWRDELSTVPQIDFPNLADPIIQPVISRGVSTKFHIFVGADDFYDFIHAGWMLQNNSVTASLIENCDHGVSGGMKRDGLLMPSLEAGINEEGNFPGKLITLSNTCFETLISVVNGKHLLDCDSIQRIGDGVDCSGVDFALGRLSVKSKDFEGALKLLLPIAQREVFSNFVFMAQVEVASCFLALGDAEKAIDMLQMPLQRKPYSLGVLTVLSKALIESKQFDEADRYLFRSIVHHPSNVGILYIYSKLLHVMGRNVESVDCLLRARTIKPRLRHIDLLLFEVYGKMGIRLSAIRELRKLDYDESFMSRLSRLAGIDTVAT